MLAKSKYSYIVLDYAAYSGDILETRVGAIAISNSVVCVPNCSRSCTRVG